MPSRLVLGAAATLLVLAGRWVLDRPSSRPLKEAGVRPLQLPELESRSEPVQSDGTIFPADSQSKQGYDPAPGDPFAPPPPRPGIPCNPRAHPPEMCPPVGNRPPVPCPACGSLQCRCPGVPPPSPTPAQMQRCDRALSQYCDNARLAPTEEQPQECGFCLGRFARELAENGCRDTHVDNFCNSNTCATNLQDSCHAYSGAGHCDECVRCTSEATMRSNNTLCSLEEKEDFCDTACAPTINCMTQLETNCGAARKQDPFKCAMCTGQIASRDDIADDCNNTLQITATERQFCDSQGCVPELVDKCATNGTCYDCASCALNLRKDSPSLTCRDKDINTVCAAQARPPEPYPVGCMEALSRYCTADRKKGEFECIQCTGEHKDQLKQCSDTSIAQFCSGAGSCYPMLIDACSHTAGHCAECAACVDAVASKLASNTSKFHCDKAIRNDFCSHPNQPPQEPEPEPQPHPPFNPEPEPHPPFNPEPEPHPPFDPEPEPEPRKQI